MNQAMSSFLPDDDDTRSCSSSSRMMQLSSLPDDVLIHKLILEFLTVPDILHLAATNQFWYQTLLYDNEQVLWKSLYHDRFRFSRQDLKDDGNYRLDFQQRYRMLQTLLQNSKQKKQKQNSCFNLPHKHFDFVAYPLHDDDDDVIMFDNDMPLVLDCCDSFCLWSGDGGISSHLVVLNPYTVEWQMQDLERAGAVIPTQGGIENDDMWGMDLQEYFPDQNIQNLRDEEFDLIPLGIDCKAITSTSNSNQRMIVVGKSLRSMERVCHEFVGTIMTMNTTTSIHPEQQQQKYMCRIPGEFHHVDVDAEHRRVMVCQSDPQNNLHNKGRSTIQVYPMVMMEEEASKNPSCSYYFPNPTAHIPCDAPVQTFVLSGPNLVVATETSLEVWNLSKGNENGSSAIHLQHRLPLRQPTKETTSTASNTKSKSKSLPRVLEEHLTQSHRHAIISLHIVTHPTTHQVTHIVTLLSSPQNEEYWIHLYDLNTTTTTTSTTPSSVIHLPLSSSRTPRISINANRLLVLGQDHVGAILLVYALRGDHDDDDPRRSRRTSTHHTIQEASGGVYNLSSDTSTSSLLHLANRIRHVALGGWHAMDHVHMVANERYIVLTTREGHHLNLAANDGNQVGQQQQPGVLVIDLKK